MKVVKSGRLPDGTLAIGMSENDYGDIWLDFIRRAEAVFPGYRVVTIQPLSLECAEVTEHGRRSGRITISDCAVVFDLEERLGLS